MAYDVLRAVSLDPGITTGWCIGIKDSNKLFLAPGQGKLSHSELWNLLRKWNPYQIICEEFEYRRGQRGNLVLYSKELIGVVRLYAIKPLELYMQLPASVVGTNDYFNNAKLDKLGIGYKGSEHGRDAMRHLLYWFTFKSGVRFNENNETVLELVTNDWLFEAYGRKL